jgi:hypothetical protein
LIWKEKRRRRRPSVRLNQPGIDADRIAVFFEDTMNMVGLRFGYDLWELVKEYANYSQPVPSGIGALKVRSQLNLRV